MTKSGNIKWAKGGGRNGARATKKDQLIKLLSGKAGLDIKALSDKLGWQQHTTWEALSGLRKAGFEIAGRKPSKGGASTYRIVGQPPLEPVEATSGTTHAG